MNNFKKTILTIATISTIAVAAAAPAQAKPKHWKHGLGTGIGIGVGLGIAGALLQPRDTRTVYVREPRCYIEQEPLYNSRGRVVSYQEVRVCD